MEKIDDVVVNGYEIPTDEPESDGTLQWEKTKMITVQIRSGNQVGFGYTYADFSTGHFIREHLKKLITGRDVFSENSLWLDMIKKIRNAGARGVGSMAISAVDIALWDLKGKILNLPVSLLLGIFHPHIPVYGSGGFTSYTDQQLKNQFENWMNSGITMFKMKVGRDKESDEARVKFARKVIGDENELFVDANGAYFPQEALKFCRKFEKYGISWFEEPVSSDNLEGLIYVREHVPAGINVTAGEYGYSTDYFRRMLTSRSVDVIQPDVTRCCGITGFIRAGILCEAFHIPLSSHTSPTASLQVCCSTKEAVHMEYFHDHERIEEMFFEGYIKPVNGTLTPDLKKPGLGIVFKEKDAEKYRK